MNNENKPSTIYDIANEVGVTPTTVSRVLNNKGYISDKTRSKVLKVAAKLNYQPNMIARSLKSSKTRQIILAVPYIREVFNFDLIAAVQEIVQRKGYSLVLCYTESSEKEELKALENLHKNRADGLILTTTNISDKLISKIKEVQKPCVLICFSKFERESLPFDYVGVDTKKGIYLATKHLIEQGNSRIAYIGPNIKSLEGRERYAGYCLAMEQSGLALDESIVFTGEHSELFGYECGKKIASSEVLPTAVCAATDLIVLGLYRCFDQRGIRIPADISIVGMDNIDVCSIIKPKISSVSIVQEEIGREAANLLFNRLADDGVTLYKNVTFEPRLIVRESSVNRSVK